jgi:ABC-type multidrug transport system ATPase subunit
VTLARAVYSRAEVVLLDGVLAALDVHTARHVVARCLGGDLLRGRTVLLVTHQLALARTVARRVVRVDGRGRVSAEASLARAVERDVALRAGLAREEERVAEAEVEVGGGKVGKAEGEDEGEDEDGGDAARAPGKLIVAEDIAHGTVSAEAVMLYLRHLGGAGFWAVRIACVVASAGFKLYLPYFLVQWENQYERHPTSEVPAKR